MTQGLGIRLGLFVKRREFADPRSARAVITRKASGCWPSFFFLLRPICGLARSGVRFPLDSFHAVNGTLARPTDTGRAERMRHGGRHGDIRPADSGVVLLGVFALLRVALIGFRAIGTLTRLPTGRTIGPTRSVRGDSGETPTGRRAGPIVHSRRVCK